MSEAFVQICHGHNTMSLDPRDKDVYDVNQRLSAMRYHPPGIIVAGNHAVYIQRKAGKAYLWNGNDNQDFYNEPGGIPPDFASARKYKRMIRPLMDQPVWLNTVGQGICLAIAHAIRWRCLMGDSIAEIYFRCKDVRQLILHFRDMGGILNNTRHNTRPTRRRY